VCSVDNWRSSLDVSACFAVNDMLIAILNCCTKEELDEVDEEELHGNEATITPVDEEEAELDEHGQKVIKDKIMLVGKMSRVFALLRYVYQRFSMSLPYAQCVPLFVLQRRNRACRRIADIQRQLCSSRRCIGIGQRGRQRSYSWILRCVSGLRALCFWDGHDLLTCKSPRYRRKADITNERLPPELIDADEEAPASPLRSNPSTPSMEGSPMLAGSPTETPPVLTNPFALPAVSPASTAEPTTPGTAESPRGVGSPHGLGSPILESPTGPTGAWKPGHGRRFSLGTTKGSPSNRRRSLDQTMALMKEVLEGTDVRAGEDDRGMERIADSISSPINLGSPVRTRPSNGLA
jgi:serine/threonine-protein phosphatase 2B catalytic subunit